VAPMVSKTHGAEYLDGDFSALPRKVHRSADYRKLGGNATKLLNALSYQFTGKNNGDLTVAFSVMSKEHGFVSKGTLVRATKELVNARLIIETKKGGLYQGPSLYALTWIPIHPCSGKLDVQPTSNPPRYSWHVERTQVDNLTYTKNQSLRKFDWPQGKKIRGLKRDHTGLKMALTPKPLARKSDH
jgi:hypothetical protein